LNADVAGFPQVNCLIHSEGRGYMIHHNAASLINLNGIEVCGRTAVIFRPDAQVPDNHITDTRHIKPPLDGNAGTGCSLAGNGHIAVCNIKNAAVPAALARYPDSTAYIKDNDPFAGLAERVAQASRAGCIEVG